MGSREKTVAIMLGRGGSSLAGKNIREVLGRPLLQWACLAALDSNVDSFFISSDDKGILDAGFEMGYAPITRPSHLATDTARGCDALRHAVLEVAERLGTNKFTIVMQHANAVQYTAQQINLALAKMESSVQATAVVPCYQVEDLHPYRQKRLLADGRLQGFFPDLLEISSNRQELPTSVALCHNFWVIDSLVFFDPALEGEPPWTCLGSFPVALITEPSSDVHTEEDLAQTEAWILNQLGDVRVDS